MKSPNEINIAFHQKRVYLISFTLIVSTLKEVQSDDWTLSNSDFA